MKRLRRRRLRNLLATLLAMVTMVWLLDWYDLELGRRSYVSGYILWSVVVVLASLNLRKRLATLPLGPVSTWLQVHIYLGLFSGILLGVHVGWRLPNGLLEQSLFVTFMMTFVSGLSGLYLTRTAPAALARVGQEVVYERIPVIRASLARQSQQAVLQSVAATGSTTLGEFYMARLYDFFVVRRSVGYMLRPTFQLRRQLMRSMRDLERYLNAEERIACERLFGMVRQKDDLDYHDARQRLLKLWIFFHIALTCALLAVGTLHGLIAMAHRGDTL
jgi:hypothetical protein